MKTVVYVSPHVDQYGAERSMIANIKNLRKMGLNVILVIPRQGQIEELLKKDGIEYIVEKFFDVINHENRVRIHYGIGKGIVNTIKAFKVKQFLMEKKYNPILVHSNSLTSNFGIILSQILKVPHIQHIRELGKYDFGMTFDMGIKYFAKECSKSDKIICISEAVYQYYRHYLPEEKMKVIYNGLPESAKNEMSKKRNVNQMLEIILVGRLSSEKGQMQAIQAVENLRGRINVHLDLYGDGVDRDKIERYIKEKNLDSLVSLRGYSNSISYSKYHLALMCSHYEAFGRVTVEYMMHALPVIGVNAGGTKEIVVHEETGYLYSDGDIDQLVDYIQGLYNNEDKRLLMGQKGLKRAKNEFSEESYCRKIYDVYKEICPDLKGDLV